MSNEPPRSALLEYLFMAEKRPAMYFGSRRANVVRHHLDGWRAHKQAFEDNDEFADHFFANFHSFVENKYNDRRMIGWNGFVTEKSASEMEEFELFMSLLRQFVAEFRSKSK